MTTIADQVAKLQKRAQREKWESLLAMHIRTWGLPDPEREFVFARPRQWRFDFAWPEWKVAVEVEGVLHGAGGRHQRAAGYERDAEKYNAAALEGWRVLRFTPKQVKSGYAIRIVDQAVTKAARGW